MAEFEALEGEKEIALAAQIALSVDLTQSQYVNVRGRNQIVPLLRRMGLPDTTTLDETIALEVAQREGMAAVLVPAVARLGGDYVFSARVIQPGSSEELAVEATRLDTSFAMAYRLASVAFGNSERRPQARECSQMAYERRDRLMDRERMHVEGTYHSRRFEIHRAAELFDALLARYPDDLRAANKLAGAISHAATPHHELDSCRARRGSVHPPDSTVGPPARPAALPGAAGARAVALLCGRDPAIVLQGFPGLCLSGQRAGARPGTGWWKS